MKAVILELQSELRDLQSNNIKNNLTDVNFEEMMREFEKRQNRKCKIIIFGIQEQSSNIDRTARLVNEKCKVSEIINQVSPIHKLKSAQNNNNSLSHMFISSDRTPRQLEYLKSLKPELKQRQGDGDDGLQIRYIRGILQIVSGN